MLKYVFAGSFLVVSFLSACSCSHKEVVDSSQIKEQFIQRFPSADSNPANKISLMAQIPKIRDFVSSLTGESCAASLAELYKEIYQLDPARVDLEELSRKKEEALAGFFELRIQLRQKVEEFRKVSALTPECLDATRNIFRASRTLEEYAAQYIYKPAAFDKKKHNILAGGLPNLLVNPKFGGFDRDQSLKSGDLLMSRGAAFTSAMIARLGDVDAQFSHVAVLYIDPKTQEKWAIESHIEVGNIVRPFSEYMKDLNFRIVVLRQPDAELAHRSADYVFRLVKQRYDKKDNIPYDFKMRMSDPNDPDKTGDKEIFCSEMARIAYREGSNAEFLVPLKLSSFRHANRDILNRLGITAEASFAPGDMDVDSRFEVVAEWRDLTRVAQSRYFDAIFTKYFEWMEQRDYQLKDANSAQASILAPLIFKGRRVQWITKILKLDEKFPLNMSELTFKTIAILNSVAKPLYGIVESTDEKYQNKYHYPMTTKAIFQILEDYREKDFNQYLKYKRYFKEDHSNTHGASHLQNMPWRSDFHFLFSPPDDKLGL